MPNLTTVKVIHVTEKKTIDLAKKYESCSSVDQLLLDSKVGNKGGGTGLTHDWSISKQIVQNSNKPVWLAGGLKPDGSKNYQKIKKFISLAHSFSASL